MNINGITSPTTASSATGAASSGLTSVGLKFRGGKVLTSPEVTPVFLGKFWSSTKGAGMESKIVDFAKTLFGSSYMKLWADYGAGPATVSAPVETGTADSPKRLTDEQIQKLIAAQITSGALPAPDGQRVYTLFLPPGTELIAPGGDSSKDGVGGYHMSFDMPDGKRAYYAAIVNSDETNGVDFGGDPLDNITITASHEWTEAATDPDVNNGKLGWYSDRFGEVGDIPIELGMEGSELYDRIDGYAAQKEWSNKDQRAEIAPSGN